MAIGNNLKLEIRRSIHRAELKRIIAEHFVDKMLSNYSF